MLQTAQERLYLTADRKRLVGEGNPKAAFLYASPGDEIPESAAKRFGIVDGKLKKSAVKKVAEKVTKTTSTNKGRKAPEDKTRKDGQDKSGGQNTKTSEGGNGGK